MARSLTILAILCVVGYSIASGESGRRVKSMKATVPALPDEAGIRQVSDKRVDRTPDSPGLLPVVGTYTTLNGFYDYQTNGGACKHIQVNPANGNIHVTYMISDDSLDPGGPLRGTAYAFSSNGGVTWNNFNDVRVPLGRRSGFPTLDLLKGTNQGLPVIANHNIVSTVLQSELFVDSPEGSGAFAELNAPPLLVPPMTGGEPIWPNVVGAADGSIVFHASINNQLPSGGGGPNYLMRTTDFGSSWSPSWLIYPGTNDPGGAYPTIANGTGRVGSLMTAVGDGVYWLESTDNGATWPASSVEIYPALRYVGSDTLSNWVGSDVVYDGNNLLAVINTSRTDGAGGFFYAGGRIEFWSQATGLVDAVPWDSTRYLSLMVGQAFHLSLGYPAIGISGSTIFVAYMAFQSDTALSGSGFNYGDIWYVLSQNGGLTWTSPVNLTNTQFLDERYPSVSKWNEPGKINLTWQEDSEPGSYAFNDLAPPSRARQVFLKFTLPPSAVEQGPDIMGQFRLRQNYPNPFNPTTRISYTVPFGSHVTLSVYDVLGREVESLVDGFRNAGTYEVTFSADRLSGGVYLYALRAGSFSEVGKMMVLK